MASGSRGDARFGAATGHVLASALASLLVGCGGGDNATDLTETIDAAAADGGPGVVDAELPHIDAAPSPDAGPPVPVELTQNTDDDSVLANNAVACPAGSTAVARRFSLAEAGVDGALTIDSVTLGVSGSFPNVPGGAVASEVRVYATTSGWPRAASTLLSTTPFAVPDAVADDFVTVSVATEVPVDTTHVVVEWFTADGVDELELGFNILGQSEVAYSACGADAYEPLDAQVCMLIRASGHYQP